MQPFALAVSTIVGLSQGERQGYFPVLVLACDFHRVTPLSIV
jgi:hypothetical protein